MELTDDCLDVNRASDTQLFRTPNREAPAIFMHSNTIYLWTSGTWGWSPCQPFLYNASHPLGPFNTSLNHTWHTYSKPKGFNASTLNYDVRDGFLADGDDWIPPRNSTLPQAESLCASSPKCQGFNFVAYDQRPPSSQQLHVAYKTTSKRFDPDDVRAAAAADTRSGICWQSQGGRPAGHLGVWLAEHVHTAKPGLQRRQPLGAIRVHCRPVDAVGQESFGTYVWLPLFIEKEGEVVWHDAWRLDNVTSPFGRAETAAAVDRSTLRSGGRWPISLKMDL